MTVEQAIKKAVEGGYNQRETYPNARRDYIEINQAFLDPSFWQSLGKAMGWEKNVEGINGTSSIVCVICGTFAELASNHWYCEKCEVYEWDHEFQEKWLWEWHCFIDHLADGKKAEDWFNELNQT